MITITEKQYRDMRENLGGICLLCGEKAQDVEPDACNYRCSYCGKLEVFGIEELLIHGQLEIV